MAEAEKSLGAVRFGPFELSLETQELRKNGVPVKLSGQAIQVLAMLTANPGKLVTREELQKKLWPAESFGDFEHGLNAAVNKVREKLGDSATIPKYVETLPGRGYRFIGQVEPEEAKPSPVGPEPPQPRWKWKLVVGIAACAAIAGLLYPWAATRVAQLIRVYQLQQLTVVPLTALPGNVASPTFSPDGSQIAFAWDGENNGAGYDLYVKAIGTEKPLRLTHRPALQLSAAWSPDGRSIAISRVSSEDYTGIYLLPPTGGPERKLSSRSNVIGGGEEIGWSPDGKHLAYLDQPENRKSALSRWLFLLRLDTLDRTLVKTGCDTVFTPSYSPRGDYLAWVCRDTQAIFSVNAQRLSDGSTLRLAQIEDFIIGMAWSGDGRRIVFSSGAGNLWEASLARPGNAQKLPLGHDALGIAVSPSAHRLAYVQGVTNTNIWRLDLLVSPPKAGKLVVSSREQIAPSISPDGSKIAFQSDRTGFNEVWVCDADGSNPIQLSSFGMFGIKVTGTPRWSPDGKWIAFDSRAGGEKPTSTWLILRAACLESWKSTYTATPCQVGHEMGSGSISQTEMMFRTSRCGKCRPPVAMPYNSPSIRGSIRSNPPTVRTYTSFATKAYGTSKPMARGKRP